MSEENYVNKTALEVYVKAANDSISIPSAMGRIIGHYAVKNDLYELAELALNCFSQWSLVNGFIVITNISERNYCWMVELDSEVELTEMQSLRKTPRIKLRTEKIEEWEYINKDITSLIDGGKIEIKSAKCLNITTFKVYGDDND